MINIFLRVNKNKIIPTVKLMMRKRGDKNKRIALKTTPSGEGGARV